MTPDGTPPATTPHAAGEKQTLHAALDRHRDAVLGKLDGLGDERLRRPMTPTGTNCWTW